MKIIALAGRKGSGKSTLSNYLVANENFTKFSFADYLRELIIDVFLIDKKYFEQSFKETELLNICTNQDFYKKISDYIKEDVTYLQGEEIIIKTPRQLLQFIGTDVLRLHDINFHVKKTLLKIQNSTKTNLVCDDLRFYNELLGLRTLNVEEYFVIRPNNWNISNHSSEKSLKWHNIKNIIINNCNIHALMNAFKNRLGSKDDSFSQIIREKSNEHSDYQFDTEHSTSKDAFIGGFICQHKLLNNLSELELLSIKNHLSNLSKDTDYIYNNFKLENLKQWLDVKFPPEVNLTSWEEGMIYYKSTV
jgi:hypothetical protein